MQNFIRDIIEADLQSGKHTTVVTRFPPEPNGYLHIGHAKAICVDFGLATEFQGRCHLRMDDTNPDAEDVEYVEAIKRDLRWLGFEWGEHLFYASDYYERLYEHAVHLIRTGKAYVCSLSEDAMREYRGSLTEPGRPSPHRARSVEENLDLFARMRAGEFAEGEHVVRIKGDMASANMKLRDPAIYRIKRAPHYRTGDAWCIYPLYDYTHCLSDAFEGITHSICTLEFENNRDLYDWVLAQYEVSETAGPGTIPCRPRQIEFARLAITYTMMSKRKLLQLVEEKRVTGWDDPRMPTIAGMRRRGITPEAIRAFCEMIGVAKNNSLVDVGKLEFCIRDDLNHRAPRAMCVLEPLAVELVGLPADRRTIEAPSFPPEAGKAGSRLLPLGETIFIEREDFLETPPPKWHRLSPGAMVRLRHAGVVRCDEVVRDANGTVSKLVCRWLDGDDAVAAKVKGTIHWADGATAHDVEVRLYDRLFDVEVPESLEQLNPRSLVTLEGCKVEPSVASQSPGATFQFERHGYFCVDPDSTTGRLVFNRTVTLRDSWAKEDGAHAEERKEKPRAKEAQPASKAPSIASLEGAERVRAESIVLEHDVSEAVAIALAQHPDLGALLDAAVAAGATGKAGHVVANLVVGDVRALLARRESPLAFGGKELAELAGLVANGTVTGAVAKDVLGRLADSGGSPAALVASLGVTTLAADALGALVDEIIAAFPDEVARYRAGKPALLGFFVGQLMRRAKGKADAKAAEDLFRSRLG
ncbi:MAG: glutamine--tRNA ligase/YqeY domain fusion protein [Deltaproteobacteria bacterium]|nr:glutamine--tRNA ligase/YqeY domain fusion protein [Deltaproteobacteria bacterium]